MGSAPNIDGPSPDDRVEAPDDRVEVPTLASPSTSRVLSSQGQRTMQRLLDAAMEAFDRRGYYATRVNDVVELAHTSHGTFYLYFANKEDLLRALVEEASSKVRDLYESLNSTQPTRASWTGVRKWVVEYSNLWVRYAPIFRTWTELADIDPDLGELMRSTINALADSVSNQIARTALADSTQPVDSKSAGLAILAMLDRFHYLREFVDRPLDNSAIDTLTTIIYRSLFQEPDATASNQQL